MNFPYGPSCLSVCRLAVSVSLVIISHACRNRSTCFIFQVYPHVGGQPAVAPYLLWKTDMSVYRGDLSLDFYVAAWRLIPQYWVVAVPLEYAIRGWRVCFVKLDLTWLCAYKSIRKILLLLGDKFALQWIFSFKKYFLSKKVFVGISPSIPLMSYLRELLSASPTLYAATSWEADRSIGPCEKRWELGREGETGRRERSTFNRWRVNGSGDVREPHRPTIPSTTTFSQLSSSHYHHLPLTTTTHTHTQQFD